MPQITVNTCEGAGIETNGGCFHNYINKLFNGKPILRCGVALFRFILVALSSKFGCTIGLVPGIAIKAAIVLSLFSFTNCCGYGI